MKSANVTTIRRTALSRINQLVRAHRHLESLRPAFAEWNAGDIYVCKKTGDYRYRTGDLGKSITPWSGTVRKLFPSAAAFAFAATVLGEEVPAQICATPTLPSGRVNVIAIAQQAAA